MNTSTTQLHSKQLRSLQRSRDQRGAVLVEYAMGFALLILAVVATYVGVGNALSALTVRSMAVSGRAVPCDPATASNLGDICK